MTEVAVVAPQDQKAAEMPPSGDVGQKSSKSSPLYWMTKGNPTNYNMLVFRTVNREMKQPNHNSDDIAPLFRNHLMPMRSWWLCNVPGAMSQFRRALENKKLGAPGVVNFVDARTKWFDEAVQTALRDGIKQVVVIAAGFDTRAYRFASPGVSFYEIDLPHASERKHTMVKKLLPEASLPTYIPADLSKVSLGEALSRTSFDSSQRTLFTCEGLIYYLPEEAVRKLFQAVADLSAPGSSLYFDFLHTSALLGTEKPAAYKVTAQSVANKGEPFISGMPPTPEGICQFTQHQGFRLKDFLSPKQMVARMLPHLTWQDKVPPILSFYSYAALEKM